MQRQIGTLVLAAVTLVAPRVSAQMRSSPDSEAPRTSETPTGGISYKFFSRVGSPDFRPFEAALKASAAPKASLTAPKQTMSPKSGRLSGGKAETLRIFGAAKNAAGFSSTPAEPPSKKDQSDAADFSLKRRVKLVGRFLSRFESAKTRDAFTEEELRAFFERIRFKNAPGNASEAAVEDRPPDTSYRLGRFASGAADLSNLAPGDWEGYERHMDIVTGTKKIGGNRIEFLVDSEAMPRLFQEIGQARKSLTGDFYECVIARVPESQKGNHPDGAWEFAKLLVRKGKESVPVRMMITKFVTEGFSSKAEGKIEVQRFKQFLNRSPRVELLKPRKDGMRPFPEWFGRPIGWERKLMHALVHLDHRKLLVRDGHIAILTDMNLGDKFWSKLHGTMCIITGPVVAAIQDIFVPKWLLSGGRLTAEDFEGFYPPLEELSDGIEVRVVINRGIKPGILGAAAVAVNRIRSASPAIIHPDVIAALCDAAYRRKIPVQLFYPQENPLGWLVGLINRSYYRRLLKAGVEIREIRGGAHHKIDLYDGLVVGGSPNKDPFSFDYNDEAGYFIRNARFAQDIQDKFFNRYLSPERSIRILKHRFNPIEYLARLLRFMA